LLVRALLVAATAAGALLVGAPAASAEIPPVCVLFTPPDGQGARPICVPG
jgi:hypothetical protein